MLAEMKSSRLKNELSGLWWIVCQIEKLLNVIGYSQRNQMEDIKPISLQRASHQSHALKQLDCSWLMRVEITGT